MIVIRFVEIRTGQRVEVEPARQQPQRPVLKGTLQTRDIVLQRSGIRVRQSFLNRVNHSVDTYAIVENARDGAHHEAAIDYRLLFEPNARTQVTQRKTIFACKHSIELTDTIQDRSPSAIVDMTLTLVL